jgi:hypothetical protein
MPHGMPKFHVLVVEHPRIMERSFSVGRYTEEVIESAHHQEKRCAHITTCIRNDGERMVAQLNNAHHKMLSHHNARTTTETPKRPSRRSPKSTSDTPTSLLKVRQQKSTSDTPGTVRVAQSSNKRKTHDREPTVTEGPAGEAVAPVENPEVEVYFEHQAQGRQCVLHAINMFLQHKAITYDNLMHFSRDYAKELGHPEKGSEAQGIYSSIPGDGHFNPCIIGAYLARVNVVLRITKVESLQHYQTLLANSPSPTRAIVTQDGVHASSFVTVNSVLYYLDSEAEGPQVVTDRLLESLMRKGATNLWLETRGSK